MPAKVKKPASGAKPAPPESPSVPSYKAALFVLGTIADTTWRIFVPILAGVALGIWYDKSNASMPIATIAGTALGAAISAGLIYQQIKQGLK